jgi:four helix bundle protein
MNRVEIETRLIENASSIIDLCRRTDFDKYTTHLSYQIVRSSSSAALNYGEAQSAESRKDFAHKLGLVLKELRETEINIQIIKKSGISNDQARVEYLIKEYRSLIAIFQKSVQTAKMNLNA